MFSPFRSDDSEHELVFLFLESLDDPLFWAPVSRAFDAACVSIAECLQKAWLPAQRGVAAVWEISHKALLNSVLGCWRVIELSGLPGPHPVPLPQSLGPVDLLCSTEAAKNAAVESILDLLGISPSSPASVVSPDPMFLAAALRRITSGTISEPGIALAKTLCSDMEDDELATTSLEGLTEVADFVAPQP